MLLGIVPFGIITGVAMVASGIPPLGAMLMSLLVFAGASMVASAQLLASGAPAALIVFTTLIINLRFMMYSASLRLHFAQAQLAQRLAIAYLTADNVYGLLLGRFSEHPGVLAPGVRRTARVHRDVDPAPSRPRHGGGGARGRSCSPDDE